MHEPVMVAEVLAGLSVRPGGRYIDATLGDGGHTVALLEAAADTQVLGLDRDAAALQVAAGRLAPWAGRWQTAQTNFGGLAEVADAHGFETVDGVLFDLGVRSDQLDRAERGFSFMREGPLDMRMDQRQETTAADLVNRLPESELSQLLWELGEERSARRIAGFLVQHRPFETTAQLAAAVATAVGGRKGRIDPATRTFMALRMAVNRELEEIELGLEAALQQLAIGGRLAVLSYHSIEDRVVKRMLSDHQGKWVSLQAGGAEWQGKQPRVEKVTRKPQVPDEAETKRNPRARSAKLRVVERME